MQKLSRSLAMLRGQITSEVNKCDAAGAEARLELRPPVISDPDEKVLPLHRRGTPPVHC